MIAGLFFLLPSGRATEPRIRAAEPDPRVLAYLQEGVRLNFSGDNRAAWEHFSALEEIDPTHPAREFFLANILFDKSGIDRGDESEDERIKALLETSIRKARQRLKRDEQDLVGLHYFGAAHMYLGRLQATRGQFLRGGMTGEKGRRTLERAMEIAPDQVDLLFLLGGYHYWAAQIPAALRTLEFLPFIPSGGRQQGLIEMERAAREGVLYPNNARYMLGLVYSRIEPSVVNKAITECFDPLVRDFPDNAMIEVDRARALVIANRYEEADRAAESVLAKVRRGLQGYDANAENAARLALVESRIRSGRLSEARAELDYVRTHTSCTRTSLAPWLDVYEGMLCDLDGRRGEATKLYRRAAGGYSRRLSDFLAKWRANEYLRTPFALPSP